MWLLRGKHQSVQLSFSGISFEDSRGSGARMQRKLSPDDTTDKKATDRESASADTFWRDCRRRRHRGLKKSLLAILNAPLSTQVLSRCNRSPSSSSTSFSSSFLVDGFGVLETSVSRGSLKYCRRVDC